MTKRSRCNLVLTLLTFCALAVSPHAGAQGVFTWKATVDTVKKDGFYQVLLTPPLIAKCRADLADVRIVGPGGRFVSYVQKNSWTGPDVKKEWMSIPDAVVAQKDSSDKHSYIDASFPEAYEVDWLGFMIFDPVFYKRDAEVYAQGEKPGEWTRVTTITIAPRQPLISIPSVKTRRLRIEIANADNAPLVIKDVGFLQSARCLLTYLRAGSQYFVLAGDAQATAPEYDLKYFTDSLTTTPPTLLLTSLEHASIANDQPAAAVSHQQPLPEASAEKKGGWVLWSILLVILILLVYFTIRLLREMQ